MRRLVPVLLTLLATATPVQARGLLVPVEKKVPPLAMLNHQVSITIDDQAATTSVEQTFRNHTDRQLEATYYFPVPKGASVTRFSMFIGTAEVKGEMVEAAKARQIYTDIVQRTRDPGLLEYVGNNLLRFRVFPIPPRGDQKVTLSYRSVAQADNGLVEYVYPLKIDGKSAQTLEKFSIKVDLKSQHRLTNIYSPSHPVALTRRNDHEAHITFVKDQALLDRDFQLYYQAGGKDVGLTAVTHRPVSGANGYFMLLLAPRAELSKSQQVPRDMVFVLDTSGSMRGKRIVQARNALKYCLQNLEAHDRFNIINFATTVNKYSEKLLPASADQLAHARKWVEDLDATGGTAINEALQTALSLRSSDSTRTFTLVFFTDGRPTIGETNAERILKNVQARNTASTRIFTFGVGDDVNATLLDQLAVQSRALSTYVRENEDIEHKVSSLYAKISNPVLTDLKLSVGAAVKLAEVYPPQLPDLFHGTQLVVFGRYSGNGHATVKLTGNVGKHRKEFVYEVKFPEKTNDARTFVEDLWARRKVGYLLDQIRANGEKKELVDEVVALAKRYGITTPYTSYLIVPDGPVPVARTPKGTIPAGRMRKGPDGKPDVRFNLGARNGGVGMTGGGLGMMGGTAPFGTMNLRPMQHTLKQPVRGMPGLMPNPPGTNMMGMYGMGTYGMGMYGMSGMPGMGGLPGGMGMPGGYGGMMGMYGGTGVTHGYGMSMLGGTGMLGGYGGMGMGGMSMMGMPISPSAGSLTAPGGVSAPPAAQPSVATFAAKVQTAPGQAAQARFKYAQQLLENLPAGLAKDNKTLNMLQQTRDRWNANNAANYALKQGDKSRVQSGKLGVDLSCEANNLRSQAQLTQSAVRRVGARNCLEVGGVWIDEGYDPKMKTVTVKAMSKAYFRILELHPITRQVFQLGNHLVWVTPNNYALVIDSAHGAEAMTDAEINRLFVVAKK